MGLLESVNRLARHFEVKPDDTPDVVAFKSAMTDGFNALQRDMHAFGAEITKEDGSKEEDGSAPE